VTHPKLKTALIVGLTALAIGSGSVIGSDAALAQDHGGGHGGYYYGHGEHGDGGLAAAGLIGGLAIGSLAGSGAYGHGYPAYGYGAGYGGACHLVRRRLVDAYGRVYLQPVEVCD